MDDVCKLFCFFSQNPMEDSEIALQLTLGVPVACRHGHGSWHSAVNSLQDETTVLNSCRWKGRGSVTVVAICRVGSRSPSWLCIINMAAIQESENNTTVNWSKMCIFITFQNFLGHPMDSWTCSMGTEPHCHRRLQSSMSWSSINRNFKKVSCKSLFDCCLFLAYFLQELKRLTFSVSLGCAVSSLN